MLDVDVTRPNVVRSLDLGRDYPALVRHFLREGHVVKSRIGETKELLNFRLELINPRLCVVNRQGFSEAFMNEEIVQLLAGRYDFDRLNRISPKAASLITEATAYGPRTWEQLQYDVCEELTESSNSRRAVVYVGRENDLDSAKFDRFRSAGEMPCTMTWQFHLRSNFLHMSVTMRSWDIVWGLTYDIPSFVAVQMAVADHLGARLGTYVHTAGSAHIYDRHYRIKTKENRDKQLHVKFLEGNIAKTRNHARRIMEGGN